MSKINKGAEDVKIKDSLDTLDIKITNGVDKLERNIQSLKLRLEEELVKIQYSRESGSSYVPNSCGIVQDLGASIDLEAAKVSSWIESKEIINGVHPLQKY